MIFSKRFDIETTRIELMLEMCDKRTALQIEEAELKVLNESGTYDDLDYLYGVIMTEAEEAKKTLSIPERIKQLITLVLDGKSENQKDGKDKKIVIDVNKLYEDINDKNNNQNKENKPSG